MKEPYESIRKSQTGRALQDVEQIKGIPAPALRLVKTIIKQRIEYTLLDVIAEASDGK